MARFSALLPLCVAACSLAAAADMHKRQTGDLQCNLERLQTLADVASAQTLLGQINTTNLTTAEAVAVAQVDMQSVDDALQTILDAVLKGAASPTAAQTQFAHGLAAAQKALSGITDPNAKAAVAAVQAKITSAITDGDKVVAECK
ncbi:hypothetical protein GGX14DRAFT_700590 [Mycena pura]|uniref:Cell wall galactomannoprotein n=1 Tax=Mycena pura TaxID=153505 RepID=A0AAD6Y8H1_9AGAR|nr:hypothetical protein GGX14DRAFT_700590 [Mycena pura]